MARLHFSEPRNLHFGKPPKTKANAGKNKISDDESTVVRQLKCPAGSAEIKPKVKRCNSPPQSPATKPIVLQPASLEQLVSEIESPPGLQRQTGLPMEGTPTSEAAQAAPWRKPAPTVVPEPRKEETVQPELGRVVCWKETGYGFVVNEAGERLFVRQAEVEGGEQLRAGQIVRFRRGKSAAGQAAKALNVTIVSQDEAKVMRKSASTRSGTSPKAANKALALPSAGCASASGRTVEEKNEQC
eukprot:gnl/TRDRNA2_/TRDRNA2_177211_c1_seq11.p1 gnl/TRDRNA2_/TRDRNA2_177211_c1~~gnl/TRDRNA2_/TRDRNA2_177211_c1_seq11.p1  ORF type:complete len:269 (-),score=64.36 gnl/TRDRNA2_/TRDRNA2_177211_c1_seq11:194-922(-)